jgi:hypothetical protein
VDSLAPLYGVGTGALLLVGFCDLGAHISRDTVMLSFEDIVAESQAQGWPGDGDSEFWPKVAELIDAGIDEHAKSLKDWWLIRRVPFWYPGINTIELNFWIGVREYYAQASSEKRQRLMKGLAEPYLGHTDETYSASVFPFGEDGIMTGTWPLKNAHHIMKVERAFQKDITEYDQIIEIGAGLGDLPRYCYDIGFRGGYTILDLPATIRIQKAYLQGHYPVRFVTDVAQIHPQPNTLVVATWSLSEIPYEDRAIICRRLKGLDWFATFQAFIMGWANTEWFPKVFGTVTETNVKYESMPFHQYQGGSFYAYGVPYGK